ncbi:MAG TPA: hypothetical protein VK994_00330 [Bacteroidales bacterium]|nr:hypothetical protein [Bacteroidales bacterium]
MKNNVVLKISTSLLLDALAVLFIVYIGKLSVSFDFPLYDIDPMRLCVVLAIVFTPRWNGWLLALLLPAASYFFGVQPHIYKSGIMAIELLINVWMFWYLYDKIKFSLLAMLLSIMFSKLVYYLLKYLCLQMGWIYGDLISTPLDTQIITTLAFSIFVFLVFLIKGKPK